MYIKHYHIKNVGRHVNLEGDLVNGVVGVVGVNGAGKSSFLSALYACITNDWSRLAARKDLAINRNCADSDESFIELIIVQDDVELFIRRSLRPESSQELRINGGEPITSEKKIQKELIGFLGIDKEIIDHYVFKGQEEMYSFLKDTPAKRADTFKALCRTKVCEKISDEVREILASDKFSLVEPVDIGALKVRLTELEHSIKACRKRLDEVRSNILSEEERDKYSDILNASDRLKHIKEVYKSAENTVGKVSRSLKKLDLEQAKLDTELSKTRDWLAKNKNHAQKCKAIVRDYESREKLASKLSEVSTELVSLRSLSVETVPEPDRGSYDKAVADKAVLDNAVTDISRKLELLADTSECPVCGTVLDNPEDLVSGLKNRREQIVGELAAVEGILNEYAVDKKAFDDFMSRKADIDSRIKEAEIRRDNYEDMLSQSPSVTAEQADKAKKFLSTFSEVEKSEATLSGRKVEIVKSIKAQSDAMEDAHQRVRDSAKAAKSLIVKVRYVTEARDKIAEDREAVQEYSKEEGRLSVLLEQKSNIIGEIKEASKRNVRASTIKDMRRILEEVRDIFHWNNLPRITAAKNLRLMERRVNECLDLFGNPFVVQAEEDLTFTVVSDDGPPYPASYLSAGQKTVLAVAFWIAASPLSGLLALDEPTAYLDEWNRAFLAEALASLTRELRGHRQVIVVTHAEELSRVFDQVVKL